MISIYIIFLSLIIAVGSSCSGDVATLQRMLENGTDLSYFEPTSTLFLEIYKFLSIKQAVALLHLTSVLFLLFSFRYYFLSTGILNKKQFYLISFVFIFNPFTLQLVTHNTRQLFFTSLISFPFNYICLLNIKNFFRNQNQKIKRVLKNKILPLSAMIFGICAHSSFPVIFIFSGYVYIIYNFAKLVINFKNSFKIKYGLNYKLFLTFSAITPFILFAFYLISFRVFQVFRIYNPILNKFRPEGSMIFDTSSPALIFSSIITLSLFFYLAVKIPKNYLLIKSFLFASFLYIISPFIFSLIFPMYTNFFARAYSPIALLTLPIALVLVNNLFETKFLNFIMIIFTISSLSLQTQKYYFSQISRDTFYSINNPRKTACSLVKPLKSFSNL